MPNTTNMMPFSLQDHNHTRVVKVLCERLDASMSYGLRNYLKEQNWDGPMAVDLSKVSFIDSAGIGALVSGLRTSQDKGKAFYLISPQEQPRQILKMLKLDRILSIVESLDGVSEVGKPGSPGETLDIVDFLVTQYVLMTEEVLGQIPKDLRVQLNDMIKKSIVMEAGSASQLAADFVGIASSFERRRILNAIVGGVTHHLNNMLVPILGEAHILGHRIQDPDLLESVAAIKGAATRISHLVRRLQGFSDSVSTKEEVADLNEIAKEAVELTRPFWKEQALRDGKTIRLNMFLCESSTIRACVRDIREAAVALIINAAEAVQKSGTITVRTSLFSVLKDRVCLEVDDDGVGMTSEQQAMASQPFYSTKGLPHAGLGLSFVSAVASRNGGSVRLRSEPGRGTMVELFIPRGEAPASPAPVQNVRSTSPLRILVVDDEDSVRRCVARLVGSMGHHVTVAAEGASALNLFEQGQFEMVLTDWSMPGMDGIALARAIKERNDKIPVLLFSGWETSKLEAMQAEGWIDAVLTKPLDADEIQRMITNLSRKKT